MTLVFEISPEKEATLKAQAHALGLSAEDYARQLLERDLDEAGNRSEPFWKSFTRRIHSLPAEVFERLPTDGASEHDHYLYGSPKRNR